MRDSLAQIASHQGERDGRKLLPVLVGIKQTIWWQEDMISLALTATKLVALIGNFCHEEQATRDRSSTDRFMHNIAVPAPSFHHQSPLPSSPIELHCDKLMESLFILLSKSLSLQ